MGDIFHIISSKISSYTGSAGAFIVAFIIILIWASIGPLFHFSDTWQLVINTGTTIVTFLMVFLIQNSQNRDSKAIQLKLDELLKAVKGARTGLVDIEDSSDDKLDKLQEAFKQLHDKYSTEEEKKAASSEKK